MRDDSPVTNADFEALLADAIEEGARFDTGLPEDILDIFDLIYEADEPGRVPLIATARQRWEKAKKDFPEDFTD